MSFCVLSAPVRSLGRDHHLRLFEISIGNHPCHLCPPSSYYLIPPFYSHNLHKQPHPLFQHSFRGRILHHHYIRTFPPSSHTASKPVTFAHLPHPPHLLRRNCASHIPIHLRAASTLQANRCSPSCIHCHIISCLTHYTCHQSPFKRRRV